MRTTADYNLAVLMTVHNRKETTLRCLHSLSISAKAAQDSVSCSVFLVDDGCTDGTRETVQEEFPDINIIVGDGTLFWNRGMYTAWKEASTDDFDFYLWLNDDTFLFEDAIKMIMESYQNHPGSIIVGCTCSAIDKKTTYGGFDKTMKQLISPDGRLQEVFSMHGNCVLISRSVFKQCGMFDPYIHHSGGDTLYLSLIHI